MLANRSWLCLHFGALAEERVGLVEEQDAVGIIGGVEQLLEILFGLADPLADDRRQIDPVQRQAQLIGDHLGGHGLAAAARPREQRADAEPAIHPVPEAPLVVDGLAAFDVRHDLPQQRFFGRRQHDVVPGRLGIDALRQRVDAQACHRCGLRPQSLAQRGVGVIRRGRGGDPRDRRRVQAELRGHLRRFDGLRRAERRGPELPLLVNRRLLDVDGVAAVERRPRLSRFDEHHAAGRCQETAQRTSVRFAGPFDVRGVNVEGHRQEQHFALPQPRQRFEIGGRRRQHFGLHAIHRQPEMVRDGGRHQALALRVLPEQLNRPEMRLIPIERAEDVVDDVTLRCRQRILIRGHAQRRDERRQPIVEMAQPLHEIDDALVRPQRARCQRMAPGLVDFDVAPVAKRALGRARIPPRRLEQREGQAEGRKRHRRIVLRQRTEHRDAGIELHRHAEQQQIAFERRQTEPAREHDQRRRRLEHLGLLHRLIGGLDHFRRDFERRRRQRERRRRRRQRGGWRRSRLRRRGRPAGLPPWLIRRLLGRGSRGPFDRRRR